MGATQLPVGVNKQASADTNWHTAMDSGFDDLNTRLTLSGAGSPDGVVTSKWVGQTYFDTTNDIVYVAKTADVNNDWVKIDALIKDTLALANALTVAGALTAQSTLAVTGVSTLTGLLNANGSIHVPTGKTVEGTSGESWLADELAAMNPLVHAARHGIGGGDELAAVQIGQVVQSSIGGTIRLSSAFQTYQTRSWTPSAGSGTARCLVFAQISQKISDWATTTGGITIRVQVNGVTFGGEPEHKVNAGSENNPRCLTHFVYATGVATGGSVNATIQAKSSSGASYDIGQGRIVLIDLGQD